LLVAAGVTFYALLAIFPGIAALISVYGLFADPASITSHLDTIANIAPGGAIDVLRDQTTRFASRGGTILGVSFLGSLAISLWTANSGIKAVFDALNIVYDEEEKRGFLKLSAVTLSFTAGVVALILLSLGAVVALPVILNSPAAGCDRCSHPIWPMAHPLRACNFGAERATDPLFDG
jgi:membrane protein